jgi:hypothetical protein
MHLEILDAESAKCEACNADVCMGQGLSMSTLVETGRSIGVWVKACDKYVMNGFSIMMENVEGAPLVKRWEGAECGLGR